MIHAIPRPDHRNITKFGIYQFVVGWTGGGAEMCQHYSKAEIEEGQRSLHGKGVLVDDGVDLWWDTGAI